MARRVDSALPAADLVQRGKLYLRLAEESGNAAHSAYNSLIRRLVSFERAAACAR
jgi:hypothetical protein